MRWLGPTRDRIMDLLVSRRAVMIQAHHIPLTHCARVTSGAIERVTDGSNGAQQITAAIRVERSAQPSYMDVDSAQIEFRILPPDAIEQLLAREYAVWVL